MKSRLLFFIPFLIISIITLVMVLQLNKPKNSFTSKLINKNFEPFSLPLSFDENKTFNSDEISGEYVLVNIFASWCIPCKIEHEFLLKLKQQYNIKIYGINWKDKPQIVKKWLDQAGNPFYKVINDRRGEAVIKFGATGAPETFLISPDGKILFNYAGVLNQDIFDESIKPLMK